MTTHPITPYHQGTDSGWSGSEASQARAARRDADGSTARIQARVLSLVLGKGPRGVTVAELRDALPAQHHGSISGALSNLHKAERLACLVEQRDRCHIYIGPDYIRGRETRPQGKVRT